MKRRPHTRCCSDCGELVTLWDREELALCEDCLAERRRLEADQREAPEPSYMPADELLPGFDLHKPTQRVLATLTPREREVLAMNPDDSRPPTREQLEVFEKRALERLRGQLKSKKPEET